MFPDRLCPFQQTGEGVAGDKVARPLPDKRSVALIVRRKGGLAETRKRDRHGGLHTLTEIQHQTGRDMMRRGRPAESARLVVKVVELGVPHCQMRIRGEKFRKGPDLEIGRRRGSQTAALVWMEADRVNHCGASGFQTLLKEGTDGFAFVAGGAETDNFRFRRKSPDLLRRDFQIAQILIGRQKKLRFVENLNHGKVRAAGFHELPDIAPERVFRREGDFCFPVMRRGRDPALPEDGFRESRPLPRAGSQREIGVEQNREGGDSVLPVQSKLAFQTFGTERAGFRLEGRPVAQIGTVVVAAEKTASHRGKLRELPVRRNSERLIPDMPRILPVPLIARPAVESEAEAPADIRSVSPFIPADHNQRSGTRPQIRSGRCQRKRAEPGKRNGETPRDRLPALHGNGEFRNRRARSAVIVGQLNPDRCRIRLRRRIVKSKRSLSPVVPVIKGTVEPERQFRICRFRGIPLRRKRKVVEEQRGRLTVVPERDRAEAVLLRTDGEREFERLPLCSDPEGPVPDRRAFCVLHPGGNEKIHVLFRFCGEAQNLFFPARDGNFTDMQSGLLRKRIVDAQNRVAGRIFFRDGVRECQIRIGVRPQGPFQHKALHADFKRSVENPVLRRKDKRNCKKKKATERFHNISFPI